jgi:hypothetical protein
MVLILTWGRPLVHLRFFSPPPFPLTVAACLPPTLQKSSPHPPHSAPLAFTKWRAQRETFERESGELPGGAVEQNCGPLLMTVGLRADFQRCTLCTDSIKPTMVRLTLARKIAAITLTLWKKGENFDVEKLKSQAA